MSDPTKAETIPPVNQAAAIVPVKNPIAMTRTGVALASLEDVFRFSKAVAVSGFAPKGLEREESIMVAIQLGMELGISPMAALQNIAVINGRPGIYGDAALALVRSSNLLQTFSEYYEVAGKKLITSDGKPRNPTTTELKDETCTAVCCYQRKGEEEQASLFSIGDAKLAGLLGKQGPWSQYPARMLKFRARGFGLRDGFGDVLKGLRTTEELHDIPREINVTASAGPAGGITEAANAAPSAVTEPPAGDRDAIITELQTLMLDHGVSESKLFDYAKRNKFVPEGVAELFALPTETLAKLKFAVPTAAVKGVAK